ncbi:MAG TPA: hypothetical protein VFW83_04560, partial [Bryobacteraceae bacterium]|nr:hypothetical protein [Bryobacteraceae bacterium]
DGPTLDAGPRFTIAGSSGTREIPRSGIYWTRLGSENPASRRNLPLFLNDPRYTFSVPGGRDIAGLSGTIPGIPHFEWINRGALASIDRLRGAAVQWRGVPKDAIVLILAASFDPASTAGGIAYCAAKNGADRFFIPPEILAHFPATGRAAGPARSGVAVIALRLKSGPSIAGADPVRLVSVSVSAREAEFR